MSSALFEYLVVAVGLQHGHVVLLLVLPYLAAYAHTLGQQVHQLIVEFVYLLAQCLYALCGNAVVADDEQREYVVQHVGRHLLLGVAPRLVGVAVALYYQSVETQVHGLLAQGGYQFAAATDVAGVTDDG